MIENDRAFCIEGSMSIEVDAEAGQGVREVSFSSRCFFGFVRKPSAFVMSFDCLLLSDVVRSFVCLLSSVYKDRKVPLSLVNNQLSSLLSTSFALHLLQLSSIRLSV
jgi:hypothetical protein